MSWLRQSLAILLAALIVPGANLTEAQSDDRLDTLEQTMQTLSRQLMMQQFYIEEISRNSANSGVKRQRNSEHGPRPYYSSSHVEKNVQSMHNHANFYRTVGMGELAMSMNGVDFRTRHNDYLMVMKSQNSKDYGATEPIPFPEVPPTVLPTMSVAEQTAEMKEWFRAWADQDSSVRDYRDYFKPVLCYMEGSWTITDQNSIDESFDSDRHHLDARSWLDMQNKVRFTSYSGTKDEFENFAYLPTTIFGMINETTPLVAQWNYRVLCHPLKNDLPLNRLVPVDDLKTRMYYNRRYENYVDSRSGRFQLAPEDSDVWEEKAYKYSLLDDIMGEVPGPDNYPGDIQDDLYGITAYPVDSTATDPMNVAYYHRVYRVETLDAVGSYLRRRGFGDENLFVSLTSQENIPGLEFEQCNRKGRNCLQWFQRWSYALPLEIIYLTPLAKWNPYGVPFRGDALTPEGSSVFFGPLGDKTRRGYADPMRAYNGTNSEAFYQTPLEFFEDEVDVSSADTTKDYRYVLDPADPDNSIKLRASGVRIFLPEIPGIGTLRQRYPIMPVSGEGLGVWKELDALKDMVMSPTKYEKIFRDETLMTTPNV